MSEFLELLETVRAEDASHARLFGDAGTSIRRARRNSPTYRRALSEAAALIAGVYRGRTPMYRLQEAMSTDDFPLLFGDILDRQLLGMYEEWPTTWPFIAKRATVRDFRTVSRFAVDGAEAVLPKVAPGQEYTEAQLGEGVYQYKVDKYGRRVPFLWEVLVNDDLDGLRSTPERLAKAARMSEERFATELFVDVGGPDTTFFSAGNANLIGNVPLDVDGLQAGLTVIRSQRDADGNPIFTGKVRLVVPPALEVTARNIVNATEIVTGPGATSGQEIRVRNWVAGAVAEVVVNPWLPIIDASANNDRTWYLFADPGIGRPAVEVGFLRGNETPALFVKSPNAIRVGGGTVNPEEGSFETDGVDYRVRHIFGGTLMEPKAAAAAIVTS